MTDKTLVQHMSEIMAIVGYIQKDATNSYQNYTYASAQAVFDKVRKELSDRGIAVCGDVELVASEVVGVPGKQKHIVVAKHTLEFTDGKDTISVSALGEGVDSGDKASMKADTAGVKYCLAKAFLISWGDDPEADEDDGYVDPAIASATDGWLAKCEEASIKGDVTKFANWWGENSVDIKRDCNEVGAVEVYNTFTDYHKRLKDEAEGK